MEIRRNERALSTGNVLNGETNTKREVRARVEEVSKACMEMVS